MHFKKTPARVFLRTCYFLHDICTCVKFCRPKWVIHICKPDPGHDFLEKVRYLSLLDNGFYKIEIDNFG